MAPEIVVSIIAASGGLVGSGLGVFASAKLTSYRIAQLEKKVEKHNNMVERTYILEGKVDHIESKLHDLK